MKIEKLHDFHNLDLLKAVGFNKCGCINQYETNIKEPTTTNNYMLLKGEK